MVEASGGSMIILEGTKASDEFMVLPGEFAQYDTAEQMGFTQQLLDQKEGTIVIDEVEYHYISGNLRGMKRKCIFLSPVETVFRRSFYAGAVVCLIGLLFVLGILVYNYSVLRLVKNHALSNLQKRLYCPERVRKVNLGVCAIGILFILVTAVSVRLAGRLYVKTAEDRSILKILSR